MNNNEELKDILEEMQENFHKGQKLVQKAKKHLGMPINGMGQRNRPHDLPPAFPQYNGDYDMYMGDIWENQFGIGHRGGGSGMGQRGGGYNQRTGGGYENY